MDPLPANDLQLDTLPILTLALLGFSTLLPFIAAFLKFCLFRGRGQRWYFGQRCDSDHRLDKPQAEKLDLLVHLLAGHGRHRRPHLRGALRRHPGSSGTLALRGKVLRHVDRLRPHLFGRLASLHFGSRRRQVLNHQGEYI